MKLSKALEYLEDLLSVDALGEGDQEALKTVLDYLKKQDKKWGNGMFEKENKE